MYNRKKKSKTLKCLKKNSIKKQGTKTERKREKK
jgi:hypothetical protein